MAEIVNLRRARKSKARTVREQDAAANRAKFGETDAARQAAKGEQSRAKRLLDGAKLEHE